MNEGCEEECKKCSSHKLMIGMKERIVDALGSRNGVHTWALRPPWLVGIGGATVTAWSLQW